MRRKSISEEAVQELLNKGYTKNEALDELAPWASTVEEVEGGYIAFEDYQDYITWINQK